jgi:predicted nucleic acid-binding protein
VLVLDAGALLAYDRGDRTVQAFLERASRNRTDVVTTTGAVAQVWRSGSRNARLAMLLRAVLEVELGSGHARRIGARLGTAKLADVVDASVVDAAADGAEILTNDPDDIVSLAAASRKTVIVTRI